MANDTKSAIEELSSKLESIKILINTMYQDLLKWSTKTDNSVDVVNRVEQTLEELAKISHDVGTETSKVNQEILNQIKTATDLFINNKTQIAEDVIKGLNFDEASRVIDYMLSRRRGPPITFGELALKFNQNVVRQVLMTMHKLGYIEWR